MGKHVPITCVGGGWRLQGGRAEFFHNDGRSATLDRLSGTLPVAFGGATYHIPVDVWLPPRFPVEAPWVHVTPTVRRARHAYVWL